MRSKNPRQLPITTPAPPLSDRPRCFGCNRRARAVYDMVDEHGSRVGRYSHRAHARVWAGCYKTEGHFCTQTCATEWANGVVDAWREIQP